MPTFSAFFPDRASSPPPPHRHTSSQSSFSDTADSSPAFSTRNGASGTPNSSMTSASIYAAEQSCLPALPEYPSEISERLSQDIAGGRPNTFYAFRRDSWDGDGHFAKRRRSGDANWNAFTSRLVTRLPSLSKRSRERKRSSIATYAPPVIRSPSSRAQSPAGPREENHIDTIVEDDQSQFAEGLGITDFESRVPTPLLHPLMDGAEETEPFHSPLQSPTVTAHSPPLSARQSVRSASSPTHDMPPIFLADPGDEWAEKLGHANFEISPEPYRPAVITGQSCVQLFQDWQTARGEFAKHLSRTQTHFGATSKTYRYTQDKWATIDAQWKRNHDEAVAVAIDNGDMPPQIKRSEPAPVAKIPDLDAMISEGKFPGMGDDDMVSPMVQASPMKQATRPIVRRPSKRAQLLRMMRRPFLRKQDAIAV